MRVYIIDFYSDKTLKEMAGANLFIPQRNDEIYITGNRYSVGSVFYDYDHMRVQVYVTER